MAEKKQFYSLPEVADFLGISRIAVFKRVKKGKLEAIRIGRNWAVPASSIAEVKKEEKKGGDGEDVRENNSLDSFGWD